MKLKFTAPVLLMAGAYLLSSCSPVLVDFYVDARAKNKYEIPALANSNAAVVASIPPAGTSASSILYNDSTLMSDFATEFARGIESNLSREIGSVPTYNIASGSVDEGDSSSIKQLAEKTGKDIVIVINDLIFELPKRVPDSQIKIETDTRNGLYFSVPAYFSAGVFDYSGKQMQQISARDSVYLLMNPEEIASLNNRDNLESLYMSISKTIGREVASLTVPKWNPIARKLYVAYSPEWSDAWRNANEFNWDKAIKIWSSLIDENNKQQAAMLAYNIAVSCEMKERYDLAAEWIDYSLKMFRLDPAVEYKKIILKKLEEER